MAEAQWHRSNAPLSMPPGQMYTAGSFAVPFPFEPYPLQLHAMESIRSGLAAGDVVVLESPTGTGKTQVLLNGVLSHVFELVTTGGAEEPKSAVEPMTESTSANSAARKRHRGPGASKRERPGSKRFRKVAETDKGSDEFLVDQDARELYSQGLLLSYFSSSSSSCSSSLAESDNEEEHSDKVPLRKPKVYFSSRTHTQLQQITDELRKTDFAKYMIRPRRPSATDEADSGGGELEEQTASTARFPDNPHKLRYVHVAGRQHLCLNASIRAASGGSNERLNELCLEAMAYEHSTEGRRARREQRKVGNYKPSLPDMEDGLSDSAGARVGCSYCQREKLKILRDYTSIESRDLSKMRELGKQVGACPFIVTRELLREADVVMIPYGYLVSAEMRQALLSGSATNESSTMSSGGADNEDESAYGHSFDANISTKNRSSGRSGTGWAKKDLVLPPNFSNDVVVVDEAHNLVDCCRNATMSSVTQGQLSLTRQLLDGYRLRYESRLLTRNKQRLREMVSFIDKLLHYLRMSDGRLQSNVEVTNLSSFVFDAGVDTVNVYRFLSFLEESRLREADVVMIPYGYLVSAEMRQALLSGSATNESSTMSSGGADNEDESAYGHSFDANISTKNRSSGRSGTGWAKKDLVLPPNFSNDVVVVDEAHNLVDCCRNATMSSVTQGQLSLTRQLLDGYRLRYESRLLTRNKQRLREMVSFIDKLLHYLRMSDGRLQSNVEVTNLSSFVFDAGVDTVNVYRFLSFLEESRLLSKLHGLVAYLTTGLDDLRKASRRPNEVHSPPAVFGAQGTDNPKEGNPVDALLSLAEADNKNVTATLRQFERFLRWYSRSDLYTRVVLRRQAPVHQDGESAGLTLELLQLEPSTYTMSPVIQQAQSVVLAGGTMKPLALTCSLILERPNLKPQWMASEGPENIGSVGEVEQTDKLATKSVRFVAEGHIVPPSSIAVFALGSGPGGQRLEFQHTNRSRWSSVLQDVAAAILNCLRVVPAGRIVFFTSYEMEDIFTSVLKQSGMYDTIKEDIFTSVLKQSGMYDTINAVKRIYREPGRVKKDESYSCEASDGAATSVPVETMLEEYAACVRDNRSNGAVLFAVMGGKLSEGINFNDDLGRAVVVVGIPYANPSDVDLQLHLQHIANTRLEAGPSSRRASTTSVHDKDATASPLSTATEWNLFTDLCMRTVNQSIGRCIRHAEDYAVVVLLDARYAERAEVRSRISPWMHPSLHMPKTYGECFRAVREFFVDRRRPF
uniref:Putative DNA repair helicase n=1 Tax=Trypanosoma vivax (strain Y486) TaxID=1055687 RepID=G0U600_TRYVY|nr:putative DNA repair helicase, fragment [Trypanosoma vivax Y486]